MSTHALLSPSGGHRWIPCPASAAMEHVIGKPNKGGPEALLGTATHKLGEMVLEKSECEGRDVDPSEFLGNTLTVVDNGVEHTFEVGQTMVDSIGVYVEYIRGAPHEKTFVEAKVDYSHIVKEGRGLVDCAFETVEKIDGKPCPTLYVVDYKNGFKRVNAYMNPQGMLYAIGALRTLKKEIRSDIKRVVIVIVQPRIDNISEYELTVDELKAWGEEVVKPKAELAWGLYNFAKDSRPLADKQGLFDLAIKSDMFGPGDKPCFYCRAKGVCKAQAQRALSGVMDGFEDLTASKKNDVSMCATKEALKDPLMLENDELSAMLKLEPFILTWLKSIRAICLDKALEGETIPGFKPIQKFGNRAWSCKDFEVEAALSVAGLSEEDFRVTKLCTPSAAEKAMKAKGIKGYKKKFESVAQTIVERLPGDKAIVPEHAKGESIAPAKTADDLGFLDVSEKTADDLGFLDVSEKAADDLGFLDVSEKTADDLGFLDVPEKTADDDDLGFLG